MSLTPKVSILVPICNVEKYLDECLSSLINQTLTDIEIICLNDGSTDSSLSIVKKYAKHDPRIVIVDKNNTGYGDTMNIGIKKSHGQYIGILESDDWAEPNMYEELYKLATENKSDIVKSNFYYYYTDLSQNSKQWNAKMGGIWNNDLKKIITEHDELARIIPDSDNKITVCPREDYEWIFYQKPCIWSAIYKRDFITKNKISFLPTPGASYQDTGFNFKALAMANKVTLTTDAFVHYRQDNEKSSMNNPGKVMCVVDEHHSIADFIKGYPQKNDHLKEIANIVKFNGYLWNLQRLSIDLAKQFITVMSNELAEDRDNNAINWQLIDETNTRILNEIIDNPDRYIRRLECQKLAKISVIVPIYNVHLYIAECLEALTHQTFTDVEIVCIDDGCKDQSVEIVEKYWQQDPRIQLIHQDNCGQSVARNVGIACSHAEYIMFCDSDDTFNRDMCKIMYDSMTNNDVDLVICGTNIEYHSNYDMKRSDRLYYSLKFSGIKQISNETLINTDVSVWNKIYKRSIINKYSIKFPINMLYEDYYFVKSYMLLSKSIYYESKKLYNYKRHAGSIMTNTFNNANLHAIDHFIVYTMLFNNVLKKYALINNYSQFITKEFDESFSFSWRYLPEHKRGDLYNMARVFLRSNSSFLDDKSKNYIYKIIPHLTFKQKIKQSIKRLYKRFSPNYRNRVAIEDELARINSNLCTLSSVISSTHEE